MYSYSTTKNFTFHTKQTYINERRRVSTGTCVLSSTTKLLKLVSFKVCTQTLITCTSNKGDKKGVYFSTCLFPFQFIERKKSAWNKNISHSFIVCVCISQIQSTTLLPLRFTVIIMHHTTHLCTY